MFLADIPKLGECEFALISEMSSQLIVHHPYRSLAEIQTSFALTTEETALAWSIINDHYLTDLPLLHAPHVIAVTAMFLAVVLKPAQTGLNVHSTALQTAMREMKDVVQIRMNGELTDQQTRVQKLVNWLAESRVDMEDVVDCTQEMISLYEVWEKFNEKVCKEQIARFVKSRGLDKL